MLQELSFFLPKINTPQELDGYSFVVGGSLGIINGELIYDSETSELSAFRLGITASAISLIKSFASNKKEAEKNIFEINNTVLKIKNILERNGKIWK